MKQTHLHHLMLMHVHKEMTNALDLISCANDFISSNENGQQVFGKFLYQDQQ